MVVPLFTTASPFGTGSGTVTVTDPAVLDALRSNPGGFYADVSTAIFPGGAARAQLHLLNHAVSTSGVAAVQESVLLGSQIYACTAQPDGSFAFTQDNVDAHLTGGIHHTFVQHGPPARRSGRHPTAARSPARSSPRTPTARATSPS